jgi:radical SAM superfamily enzyme YgiQ (UPF0313 family)
VSEAPPRPGRALLLSTYDLGRQPFGLASPAAWLHEEGWAVACQDLTVENLDEQGVAAADLIAVHLPMHTATRLASDLLPRLRAANPAAHLCCYGLYAPLNDEHLRRQGAQTILGGEFEQGLLSLARRVATGSAAGPQRERTIDLGRQRSRVPHRQNLPPLSHYARLQVAPGEQHLVGNTLASRGCKHRCRHCPVVPVYNGRFRIVDEDAVLEDVRHQVRSGARHITFGDPDFFNAPARALGLLERLQSELPDVTYDVTIKVEHLLAHQELLPSLRRCGCILVTTAVESLDDEVLRRLDKGHTRADFLRTVELLRQAGLAMNATFIPFTPWTSLASYHDILATIRDHDLVDHVAPIQYGIRLLITTSSRLLELDEIRTVIAPFDAEKLVHPWSHPDASLDALCEDVLGIVQRSEQRGLGRREIFRLLCERAGLPGGAWLHRQETLPRIAVPFLTEPWYC